MFEFRLKCHWDLFNYRPITGNKIPALVQIMAWRRPGDKPLSEPMLVRLPTHICVTPPQWVNVLPNCITKPSHHRNCEFYQPLTEQSYDFKENHFINLFPIKSNFSHQEWADDLCNSSRQPHLGCTWGPPCPCVPNGTHWLRQSPTSRWPRCDQTHFPNRGYRSLCLSCPHHLLRKKIIHI